MSRGGLGRNLGVVRGLGVGGHLPVHGVGSKKLENLEHAIALHYMHYNFCRIHQTLRVTPAMEAGVSDHVWSIEEIIDLLC